MAPYIKGGGGENPQCMLQVGGVNGLKESYHVLQWCCTKHFKNRVGFGGRNAQNYGLLPYTGGVFIQGGTKLPVPVGQKEKKKIQYHFVGPDPFPDIAQSAGVDLESSAQLGTLAPQGTMAPISIYSGSKAVFGGPPADALTK